MLAAPALQYSLRNKIKKLLSLDGQPTVGRKLAVVPRRTDSASHAAGLWQHCRPVVIALTPVLLTSDLLMLEELKAYRGATERPVHLVTRRTYQEITALLVSRQVDADGFADTHSWPSASNWPWLPCPSGDESRFTSPI
jgi:hypothetical protein